MTRNGLHAPSDETLEKYGMTLGAFWALAKTQDYVCGICQKLPKSGRLCIDHDHVKGSKTLPAALRVLHVRGLLCFVCNKYYCGRGITLSKAMNLVEYLRKLPPFQGSEKGNPNGYKLRSRHLERLPWETEAAREDEAPSGTAGAEHQPLPPEAGQEPSR